MAYFLDVTDEGDLALVHAIARGHAELTTVVDEAERDVLLKYTVRTGTNTFEVKLEGYNDVDPAASHATLVACLKRAVAYVASHRLRNYDRTPGYQKERLDVYEYDRGSGGAAATSDRWPTGWDAELRQFFGETSLWFHI